MLSNGSGGFVSFLVTTGKADTYSQMTCHQMPSQYNVEWRKNSVNGECQGYFKGIGSMIVIIIEFELGRWTYFTMYQIKIVIDIYYGKY